MGSCFLAVLIVCAVLSLLAPQAASAQDFPAFEQLASNPELPDPLAMLDGTRVTTREQWETRRKPELKALFQHWMYGALPAPVPVTATVTAVNTQALGGKATLKQIELAFGPPACPRIHLLLAVPNARPGGAPAGVFLGLNFDGNHTVLNDPGIALPKGWVPKQKGMVGNEATEAERGKAADSWCIEHSIERGYAVATYYCGDVVPDKPGFDQGVFPHFRKAGAAERSPDEWGALAAWAWGLHRCVDYLVTDKDLDAQRIVVWGWSRCGKSALVAGAFDERIAGVIPHQAGCGGSSPNRCRLPKAESVTAITQRFPHWFGARFAAFGGHEDRLPFDQHALVALCAPRAVLITSGSQDLWSNPDGQFEMLLGARPVYALFGLDPLSSTMEKPELGRRVGGTLSYCVRDTKHQTEQEYWNVFLDFADQCVKGR